MAPILFQSRHKMKTGKLIYAFTALYILLCLCHIVDGIDAEPFKNALTKGLPILLLFIGVLASRNRVPLVLAALGFSLAGDVIAEIPLKGDLDFLLQIGFFAIAQVCYIFAFSRYHSRKGAYEDTSLSLVPWFCGVYAACVLGMVISACAQHRRNRGYYIAGALLFLISDGIIGLRVAGVHIPGAGPIIMATYYAAQYFLNICLIRRPRIITGEE